MGLYLYTCTCILNHIQNEKKLTTIRSYTQKFGHLTVRSVSSRTYSLLTRNRTCVSLKCSLKPSSTSESVVQGGCSPLSPLYEIRSTIIVNAVSGHSVCYGINLCDTERVCFNITCSVSIMSLCTSSYFR